MAKETACQIFQANNLKGVFNKYSDWLHESDESAKNFKKVITVIDIKIEREIPSQANKGEGFADIFQTMMAKFHGEDEDRIIPPTEDEIREQREKMAEFFETEPVQYFMLVTFTIEDYAKEKVQS